MLILFSEIIVVSSIDFILSLTLIFPLLVNTIFLADNTAGNSWLNVL